MTSQPNLEQSVSSAKNILTDTIVENVERKSGYESGWGFFDEHLIDPPQFQVTSDDDYLVDVLLGEKKAKELEPGPLSPEKRLIAEEGVRRLFITVWDINNDALATVGEAREKLYEIEQPDNKALRDELHRSGKNMHYQVSQPGKIKYHEMFKDDWYGQFLHFGVAETPTGTPEEDKLDTWMRVYMNAKPEYAADIASEIVMRMRSTYNKSIYGKIHDISSAESQNTPIREDNLLLYLRTHSEMTAAAAILKILVEEMPGKFKKPTDSSNRARKTDIPFISIAEEPIQNGIILESFNSSREGIESKAESALALVIAEHTGINIYSSLAKAFQYVYKNSIKSKQDLKEGYRLAVQAEAVKHGVSDRNYAMNLRDEI